MHGTGFALICLGLSLGVAGCVPIDCTTEARSSVTVTVIDEEGAPLTGATLTYSVDGAAEEPCLETGSSGTWTCGFELAGVFTIHAEKEGYVPAEDTVTVTEDECHVETQMLELTLAPKPPSVSSPRR